MSVEPNVFNVGAWLFGMVMWADFLVFLGSDYLGKMVGRKLVIEMAVEMVLEESVKKVWAKFLVFLERDYLGKMKGAKVVIEVVVEVVVLVWWR